VKGYPLTISSWGDEELRAIQRVVDNDRYTMGVEVEAFEREFAAGHGSRFAIMVNSGSSANLLAVASLFFRREAPLRRGDEVIVPAVSWSTTYFPLQQFGLRLKFVDVDADTLNMDLDALRDALTDRTRLVFAVNLLGNPNDFGAMRTILVGRDIALLEDNCESLGAELEGRMSGTFGLIGTFSSYFSHHLSTMEGGMLLTDDEELYHILLSLRAHGWTRSLPEENHVTTKSTDLFLEQFRFVLPGYNVRPLEMSGAIGREQWKKFPTFLETRRKNADYFHGRFANHPELRLQTEVGKSSHFGFAMVIRPGSHWRRREVVRRLHEAGIECRPIVAGNFARNDVIRYFDYEIFGSLSNADHIDRHGFFVGNYHVDLRPQIDLLVRTLALA